MKGGVTILPVVAREMLVTSRRKQTYGMRMALALITVIATAVTTVLFDMLGAPPIKGPQLFQILTFIAYAMGVMAATGTLDSVALEKREGTLGLLFLTRLKGFDIVLGKLAPMALLSLYGLISVIPVMAIPMLMGGVSMAELLRIGLGLATVIFWSLSLGLLISVLIKNPARAMAGLGVGLAIWAFMITDIITNTPLRSKAPEFFGVLALFTPKYVINMASGSAAGLSTNMFWTSWSIHLVMTFGFLWAASVLLPHSWQDKPGGERMTRLKQQIIEWKFGASDVRERLRRRLLEVNASFWLRSREIVSGAPLLFLIFLLGCIAVGIGLWPWNVRGVAGQLVPIGAPWVFTFMSVTFAWLATVPGAMGQALAEDRQSGALDLLVATPLEVQEIVRGHWLATARKLALPAVALFFIGAFAFNWFMTMLRIEEKMEPDVLAAASIGLRAAVSASPSVEYETGIPALMFFGGLFLLPIAVFALGWSGLLLGVKVQQPKNVPGLSFPMVAFPPWAIFLPIRGIIMYGNSRWNWRLPENGCTWVLLWVLVAAGYMLTLGLIARGKVLRDFRRMATDRFTNVENSLLARLFGIKGKP